MKITYTFPDYTKSFSEYEKHLPLISRERQEKIARIKIESGKIESLFAELLARSVICEDLNTSNSEIAFAYNEYGKPYLINNPGYYFSISHSGSCVVFARADNPVGVDCEEIKTANLKICGRFFAENEKIYINSAEDKNAAFFKIWTAKEAYIKMLGTGFATPLSSFDTLGGLLPCQFTAETIGNYIITVCAEKIGKTEYIYKNFAEF